MVMVSKLLGSDCYRVIVSGRLTILIDIDIVILGFRGGAVAEWVRALAWTGDRTVPAGFESYFGKLFSSELWQFHLPRFASVFRRRHQQPWVLLSGVYARGSKISHQSALECVTVVDSTTLREGQL